MNNLDRQFSKIYDELVDKIYRFVYLKVSSQEVAEDLTSRVFIKGWDRYRQGVDKIENPKAFYTKWPGIWSLTIIGKRVGQTLCLWTSTLN